VTPEELVEACRRGDPDAQRALYDATCDRVYRLLLRMTRNSQDAFDLAQETYLKAFTRIGQFDAAASVTTWLYRIAVNEALQFLRSDTPRAGSAADGGGRRPAGRRSRSGPAARVRTGAAGAAVHGGDGLRRNGPGVGPPGRDHRIRAQPGPAAASRSDGRRTARRTAPHGASKGVEGDLHPGVDHELP
jgi:hypothetical protein